MVEISQWPFSDVIMRAECERDSFANPLKNRKGSDRIRSKSDSPLSNRKEIVKFEWSSSFTSHFNPIGIHFV
jgi:hypothetical protein